MTRHKTTARILVRLAAWSSFALTPFTNGFSQPFEYRFHTYPELKKYEVNEVHAIAEDPYGFILLGTDAGLFRFDGDEFSPFGAPTIDRQTQVNDLLFDGQYLWVASSSGLHRMTYATEQFTVMHADSTQQPDEATALAKAGDVLWIGSYQGVYRYSTDKDTWHHYNHAEDNEHTLAADEIGDVLVDKQGRVWVATLTTGLDLLPAGDSTFVHFRHQPSDTATLSGDGLRKLAEAPDGRIFVGTEDSGFNTIDPVTLAVSRYMPQAGAAYYPTTSAYTFLSDSEGKIWIGTWANGLYRYDESSHTYLHFVQESEDPFSLSANYVITIFESSSGDVWFGSFQGGLTRWNPQEQQIVRFRHKANNEALATNFIKSVYEDDDGILWIGTRQAGLHRYDPTTEKFDLLLASDGSRDAMARGTIWSISPSADRNVLWIGTSRGVGKLNKTTRQISFFEPDPTNPDAIIGNNVLKVLDDRHGTLWAGSWYGGLNRMDIATGKFRYYGHDPDNPGSLASSNINELYIDRDGQLWIGTDASLSRFDDGKFINYPYETLMIGESPDGTLWVSTSEGLGRFDKATGTMQLVGENEGFATSGIGSVLVDSAGIVWAGSDKGIDRYDPASGKIIHFDESDGLAGNDNVSRACYLTNDGRLYFGGNDGLSFIDPSVVSHQAAAPSIVFTTFLLSNRTVPVGSDVLPASVTALDHIALDYTDYIFAFEFAALAYNDPDRITYAYKLDGFDEDWIITDSDNKKATYTNVPPGAYQFRVKAIHDAGRWEPVEVVKTLTVIPPWWKTTWATVLFGIMIAGLGYTIFSVRVAVIQRQKLVLEEQVAMRTKEVVMQKEEIQAQAEKLEELNSMKNKLFSIISHDLRSPLNSLRGIMQLLHPDILNKDDLQSFKQNLSNKIDALNTSMVALLDWAKSQLEGETRQPENISLAEIGNEILALYEESSHRKGISLSNNLGPGDVAYADPHQVRIILRNLVGNAIKFCKAGDTVSLYCVADQASVTMEVRDTGAGMDASTLEHLFHPQAHISTTGTAGEKGVGLGLLLVKEFVEKNGGSIWAKSVVNEGSSFFFTLDVKR